MEIHQAKIPALIQVAMTLGEVMVVAEMVEKHNK